LERLLLKPDFAPLLAQFSAPEIELKWAKPHTWGLAAVPSGLSPRFHVPITQAWKARMRVYHISDNSIPADQARAY